MRKLNYNHPPGGLKPNSGLDCKPTTKPHPRPKGIDDTNEDRCPVCGIKEYTLVSPEVEFFYIQGCRGPCTLNICLKCGTVYIPKGRLEEARKFYDQT